MNRFNDQRNHKRNDWRNHKGNDSMIIRGTIPLRDTLSIPFTLRCYTGVRVGARGGAKGGAGG